MRKPRFEKVNKQVNNKGAWTKEEDQTLINYINTHGEGCWRSLPTSAGLHRCGKSCRLRWINYLRPDIKRGNFSHDEEDLIIKLHALLGNRWSLIAGRLPGRTDNEVKNYWNSHMKKKLTSMGIDPNNHRLNQTLPPRQNQQISTVKTTSSGTIDASDVLKTFGDSDKQQVSDAESCLKNEISVSSHQDLDLELSVAIPSSSPSFVENKPQNIQSEMTDEVQCDPYPTLLLFR